MGARSTALRCGRSRILIPSPTWRGQTLRRSEEISRRRHRARGRVRRCSAASFSAARRFTGKAVLLYQNLAQQAETTCQHMSTLHLLRYTFSTNFASSARRRAASTSSPCMTAYSSNASSRLISSIVSSLCGIAICATFYCVTPTVSQGPC